MSEPLEYRVLLECLDRLVTALKFNPASLADELAAKGLVPPGEFSYQRTNAEQARELAGSILDRVKLAPHRYRDVLDVFSRHEWLADFVRILQTTHNRLSERPKQEYVDCHAAHNELASTCDEFSCDLDDIPHCKSSLKVSNAVVRFSDLDEDDLDDLYYQMNELTRKIDIEFEKLLNKVFKSFRDSQHIDRDCLVLTLTKHEAFTEEELIGTKTVFDVFKTIKPHCSYFNYDILETLVQVNGSIQDKGYLKDYLQAFSAYCKAMPCAEEICGSEDTKSKRTKLKFKLDFDREQLKPDAIRSIKSKIASHLRIRPRSLYLCRVKEGCILLEFLVPTFILERLFPLTDAQKIALYEDVNTLFVEYQTIQLDIKGDAKRLLEGKKASENEEELGDPEDDPVVDDISEDQVDSSSHHSGATRSPRKFLTWIRKFTKRKVNQRGGNRRSKQPPSDLDSVSSASKEAAEADIQTGESRAQPKEQKGHLGRALRQVFSKKKVVNDFNSSDSALSSHSSVSELLPQCPRHSRRRLRRLVENQDLVEPDCETPFRHRYDQSPPRASR